MVKARKYVVKETFCGAPQRSNYEIVEYKLPPLQNGQILVKTEWVSVDPCHRVYNPRELKNSFATDCPYDQFGYQVGLILETRDEEFPVGTRVVSHNGWCDYSVMKTDGITPVDKVYKLPDLKGLPTSLGIGAIGMPGATAYFGFLEICNPKPGETVVVTGAAGAVGSIVGQIAKIKGCKVIGFAGSDNKVKWLVEELGFDAAFNYKTADIGKALKQAAPKGVDCFFDNVGGEMSSTIMYQMRDHGRVAVCGIISAYTDDGGAMPEASILQPALVSKQLYVEGFIVWRWFDRWGEAFVELTEWIKSGQLKAPEQVTDGFDNIFDAFVGMMSGKNYGKVVVKV